MEITDRKQKVDFLSKILLIAKENPEIITDQGKIDKGRGIFQYSFHAVGEECTIGLHLDEKGKPYFRVKGTYVNKNGDFYTSEELLNSASRYFKNDLVDFKNDFFLHKTRLGGRDLLDELKN